MKKLVLVPVLAMAVSGAVFANENMIGRWNCKMVSEYGDFEFELTLNGDSTYAKKTDFYGSVTIDTGHWTIEGEELVMNRTKSNKNGEEKDSALQFRRAITSVSDTNLQLKHDEVVTNCTRS